MSLLGRNSTATRKEILSLSKLKSSMQPVPNYLVSIILQTRRRTREECDDLRGGGQRPDPVREVLPQRSPYDHQGVQRTNTKGELILIFDALQ